MGTNYYIRSKPCECCGRGGEPLHIGKSSVGWKFSFHVEGEIDTGKKWREVLFNTAEIIEDEYGDQITGPDLWDLIEYKQHHDKLTLENCWQLCGCSPSCHDRKPDSRFYLDEDGYSFSRGEFC